MSDSDIDEDGDINDDPSFDEVVMLESLFKQQPDPFTRLPKEVTKQILDYVWGSTAFSPPTLRFPDTRVPYLVHLGSVCRLFRQLSNNHPFWCEDCHWHNLFKKPSLQALLEAYDVFSSSYDRIRTGFKRMDLTCAFCRAVFMPTFPVAVDNLIVQRSRRFLRRIIIHNCANTDYFKEYFSGLAETLDDGSSGEGNSYDLFEEESWTPSSDDNFVSPIRTLLYKDKQNALEELKEQQPDIQKFDVFDHVVDIGINDRLMHGFSDCCFSYFPNLIRLRVAKDTDQTMKSVKEIEEFCPLLKCYVAEGRFRVHHHPKGKRAKKTTFNDLELIYRLCTRPTNPVSLITLLLRHGYSPSLSRQTWIDAIIANAATLDTFGFCIEVDKDFPFVDIVKAAVQYCPELQNLIFYCRNDYNALPFPALASVMSPFKLDLVAELGDTLRHNAPKLESIKIEFIGKFDYSYNRFQQNINAGSVENFRLQIIWLGQRGAVLKSIVRDDGFEPLDIDFTSSLNKYHRAIAASIGN